MNRNVACLCFATVAIAAVCLVGFLARGVGVTTLVVMFWASAVASLVTLAAVRKHRLFPLGAAAISWALLLPVAPEATTWSAWLVGGFAP
jgi:hypothetical protein